MYPSMPPMTPVVTVLVVVRSTTSRVPFRPGTYRAVLEEESSQDYTVLGMTQGHATWTKAASAALRLADRRGYLVTNRALVERKILSESL
jgi:hypothetical protein